MNSTIVINSPNIGFLDLNIIMNTIGQFRKINFLWNLTRGKEEYT